jgi:hypothetical protein
VFARVRASVPSIPNLDSWAGIPLQVTKEGCGANLAA